MDSEGSYSFGENALEYPTDVFTDNGTTSVVSNHWNSVGSHGQRSDETLQELFTNTFGTESGSVNDRGHEYIFDGKDANDYFDNQLASYSDDRANCGLNGVNHFEGTLLSASQEITTSPFNEPSSNITANDRTWQYHIPSLPSNWGKNNTASSHENVQYSLKNATTYLKSWDTPATAGTYWPTGYSLTPTAAWTPKDDSVAFDQSARFPGAYPGIKSSNHMVRMGGLPGPDPKNALSYPGLGESPGFDPLSASTPESVLQNGLWENHSPIDGMALESLLGQWGGRCPWPNCESTAILKTQKLLETHLYNLHINPLRCHIHGCKYTKPFAKQGDLNRHIETIHKQSRIFRCSQKNCERNKRGYPRKDKLKLHLKEHGHWPFKCPHDHCKEGFLTKGELDSHVEIAGHIPFKCWDDHCDEEFLANCELESHVEISGHWPFKCSGAYLCKRGFMTKDELVFHAERSGHWPFICPQYNCWRKFLTKGELESHLEKMNHWVFKCSVGHHSKRFVTKSEYESHLDARGHWPFKCSQNSCNKGFYTMEELESHVETIGHWPFKCLYNHCNGGFFTKHELVSHELGILDSHHGAWECAVGDCAGSTSHFSCMTLAKHFLGCHWQQAPLSPKDIRDKIRHFTDSSPHATASRHITGPIFQAILGPFDNISTWCRCKPNRCSE